MTIPKALCKRLTTASKERLQQFRALGCQHAFADLHLVVQLGVVQHLQNRMDRARLGIVGAINQAFQPGVYQRTGAHGAGLNCNKQFAVFQAMVTRGTTRLSKRDDLGVGGGIGVGKIPVPASPDDFVAAHHNSPDWHLTGVQGALSGANGFLHPEFVSGGRQWLVVRRWSLIVGHGCLRLL
jgi:hypothetical protein